MRDTPNRCVSDAFLKHLHRFVGYVDEYPSNRLALRDRLRIVSRRLRSPAVA